MFGDQSAEYCGLDRPGTRLMPTITLDSVRREASPFMVDAPLLHGAGSELSNDGYVWIRVERQEQSPFVEKIWLPFQTMANPHTQGVALKTATWAMDHGFIRPHEIALLDGLRRSRFEVLAGLTCPDTSERELELITNLYVALFFFDDLLDDKRSVIGRNHDLAERVVDYLCLAVADEELPLLLEDFFGRDRVVALGSIFQDVGRRIIVRTSREAVRPFVQAMCDYFLGCLAEIRMRGRKISSVDEYANIRLHCSAVYPAVELGVLVRGIAASPDIREDGAFGTMLRAANLCVSYVNDIFSYEKEARAGEGTNLVSVLREIHGKSTEDAMASAVEVVDLVVDDYLEARQKFLGNHPDSKVGHLYARQMETWMRGNLDWYNYGLTDRYVEFLTTARPA